jgi:hypothetical protein
MVALAAFDHPPALLDGDCRPRRSAPYARAAPPVRPK